MSQEGQILIIAGPTATGKSDVALRIAGAKNAVIINADSKQVYKEIPLITAQPHSAHDNIHHLYGYISITYHYSVKVWLEDVMSTIESAWEKNKIAILVGGTGMYINSLLTGSLYTQKETNRSLRDKLEHQLRTLGNKKFYDMLNKQGVNINEIHHHDSYRLVRAAENFLSQNMIKNIKYKHIFNNVISYVLMPERTTIYNNINERFIRMLELGVIDEIKSIRNKFTNGMPAIKACGVVEILKYMNNNTSLSSAITEAQRSTRKYAKRQITWFRNQSQNAIFVENCELLLKLCLQT